MAELRLALDDAYGWEEKAPNQLWMTQPIGDGEIETYTWAQAMDQVRRMAAHLKSLNLEPGSHIGLISKNCAHFIFTDLAIWMAGHVSVALYPTLNADTIAYILEHSESKLLFVGKLDGWEDVQKGIPADMACISFPLAPPNDYESWDSITARTEPLQGKPSRGADELAIIVYTSGSTGRPKGVMHNFGAIAASADGAEKVFGTTTKDRMLSYLPLAHVFERYIVEIGGHPLGDAALFCGVARHVRG